MPPVSKVTSQSRASKQGQNLAFPEDIGPHGMIMLFKKYTYTAPGTSGLLTNQSMTENVTDSITLPIPTNLQDTYSIRLGRPESGILGESISNASAGVGQKTADSTVLASLQNSAMGMMMSEAEMSRIFQGDYQNMASNARFLMRSLWRDTDWGSAIDRGLGTVINPKVSLAFEGVELKNHSFEWNFMPRSADESESLKNIINVMKKNYLPAYRDAGGAKKTLLRYPSLVDIYFIGLQQDYFFHFKTCMIQGFSANYSDSDSIGIMSGGKPASIMMSIQLSETNIHTSEDYGGEGGGAEVDVPYAPPTGYR